MARFHPVMTSGVDGEGFWRFSLAFYSRPGVADALLHLQDAADRNVNVILFALWAGGVLGRALSAADIAAAHTAVQGLDRDVVVPLRWLRRGLKTAAAPESEALRRRIAALELAAERCAQRRLAADLGPAGSDPAIPDPADLAPLRASPVGGRAAIAAANLALVLGRDASTPEAERLGEALRRFLARRP